MDSRNPRSENFPNNSKRARGEDPASKPERVVPKVISGKARLRKKPVGRKFRDTFFGGGDARGVGGFLMLDVIVPALQETFVDAIIQGAERAVFGEATSRARGSRGSRGSRGYHGRFEGNRSRSRDGEREESRTRSSRSSMDIGEIVVDTRVEADEVIDTLFSIISEYEVATVADLFSMIGEDTTPTDRRWGWEDIRPCEAVRLRSGEYLIDLPKPAYLD